ncbi:MAG: hypothetical protein OEO21_05815 [Candidatus Krumholzibacteria bacterium]|nr:hypothetical protein [Candidatus Krumholzibacteria bacterium]
MSRFACVGVAALILGGCFLPPAGNVQDARTVGKGNVRVTGFWSGIDAHRQEGDATADEFGALIGVGGSDRSEIQLRFERLDFRDEDEGYQFISLGPKFGLIEDRLALLVPIGWYLGEDIEWTETLQIHPGLLETFPVNPILEINAAQRLILPFSSNVWMWLNLGLGVGLSTNFDRWAILPEISYSVSLDEKDTDVFSYGVAVVVRTGD